MAWSSTRRDDQAHDWRLAWCRPGLLDLVPLPAWLLALTVALARRFERASFALRARAFRRSATLRNRRHQQEGTARLLTPESVTRNIAVRLTNEQHDRLSASAARHSHSISEEVRRLAASLPPRTDAEPGRTQRRPRATAYW